MKPSDETEIRHDAEAVVNPRSDREPGWRPAVQPDSVIGFDADTGQALTKAEVFPDAPNSAPPPPRLDTLEGTEPKTALEHLQEGDPYPETLNLDQDPRQYEADDSPGGWEGRKPQVYQGDLKEESR